MLPREPKPKERRVIHNRAGLDAARPWKFLMARGAYEEAADRLIAQINSHNFEMVNYDNLVQCLMNLNRLEEAEVYLNKAEKLVTPADKPRFYKCRASLYCEFFKSTGEEKYLKLTDENIKPIEDSPLTSIRARLYIICVELGRPLDALIHAEYAHNVESSISSATKRAAALETLGKHDDALKYYKEAYNKIRALDLSELFEIRNCIDGLYLILTSKVCNFGVELAILYKSLLEKISVKPERYLALARYYASLKLNPEAEEIYLEVFENYPHNLEAKLQYAYFLGEHHRHKEAIALLLPLESQCELLPKYYHSLAINYKELGNNEMFRYYINLSTQLSATESLTRAKLSCTLGHAAGSMHRKNKHFSLAYGQSDVKDPERTKYWERKHGDQSYIDVDTEVQKRVLEKKIEECTALVKAVEDKIRDLKKNNPTVDFAKCDAPLRVAFNRAREGKENTKMKIKEIERHITRALETVVAEPKPEPAAVEIDDQGNSIPASESAAVPAEESQDTEPVIATVATPEDSAIVEPTPSVVTNPTVAERKKSISANNWCCLFATATVAVGAVVVAATTRYIN